MRETDRHYVLSSWTKSYCAKGRDTREHYSGNWAWFFEDYTPIVQALLQRSCVTIASLQTNADVIAGWMAWEGDVLHYVVTKPNFRRLGVATWMLKGFASQAVSFTHRTSDARRCRLPDGWMYRRYRIWPQEKAA